MSPRAAQRQKRRRIWPIVLVAVLLLAGAAAGGYYWLQLRLYPYDLKPMIEPQAQAYGLDPLFVAAVIRTESNFRAEARSSVGALGLMQIMPGTGEWVAKKNDWTYSDDLLLDRAYNIQLGCWYLNYLSGRFDGDVTLALAAYNAGEGNVRKWVQQDSVGPAGEKIPFGETRNFVKKVLNAYEVYKRLYPKG